MRLRLVQKHPVNVVDLMWPEEVLVRMISMAHVVAVVRVDQQIGCDRVPVHGLPAVVRVESAHEIVLPK